MPKQRVTLAEDGVARGVVWDRRTAKRAGGDARSTGHAPPVGLYSYGPLPFALSMRGGDAESLDELVELVGDGIYVTRLHYLGIVHPREGVITGMTRDGTFRIRDGKIAEPLVNLRFTVAVPDVLADVPGISRDVMLVNQSDFYGERYPIGVPLARDRHGAVQHHRRRLDARYSSAASRGRSRRRRVGPRSSRGRAGRRASRRAPTRRE